MKLLLLRTGECNVLPNVCYIEPYSSQLIYPNRRGTATTRWASHLIQPLEFIIYQYFRYISLHLAGRYQSIIPSLLVR